MLPFIFRHTTRDLWTVLIAHFDYTWENVAWMEDSDLGSACLVPSVDVYESRHEFSTESDALQFVKNWWQSQP